jgi:class 3 adenylate cyclase
VGSTLRGEAVSLASVLAGVAGPGQVVVSETVRELVMGSSLEFADIGAHDTELSLPGRHLYRLERG